MILSKEFWIGVGVFSLLYALKKPARNLAVATVSDVMALSDKAMEITSSLKEEFEDIVAEAHQEHMKKKLATQNEQ